MTLDPRAAHLLPQLLGRTIPSLLPGVEHDHLHQLQQEFARYLTTPAAREHQTAAQAWNAWTGATPQRPGVIAYTPHRCGRCHGKGFDLCNPGRSMVRTGNPYTCPECRGNRRGQPVRQTALWAAEPERASDETEGKA